MRIGLISDTHMPERWPSLWDAVFRVFDGVDLVLHAGDVGELWVLDRLGTVAPTLAVHGNDESPEAQAALPYQLVVMASGTRLFLCHSHRRNREEELAARAGDAWEPKLAPLAAQAREHGAEVYVFGHLHIPCSRRVDGVLLVNPGAIASASYFTRQTVQSVAVLNLEQGIEPQVFHHRVDGPGNVPVAVWEEGFAAAMSKVSEVIATAEVREAWRIASTERLPMAEVLAELIPELSRRRWAGDDSLIDPNDVLREAERRGVAADAVKSLADIFARAS